MGNGSIQHVPLEQLQDSAVGIFRAIKAALKDDHAAFVDCIRLVAESLAPQPRNEPPHHGGRRGGLLSWQVRKVRSYVDAHLDSRIAVADLAAQVNLSRYHFSRAFRCSFGDSPHLYVSRRRIALAQGLMLTTKTPLGQIAAECGLADQPHFNRMFRRFVGQTPAAWRRARPPVALDAAPAVTVR